MLNIYIETVVYVSLFMLGFLCKILVLYTRRYMKLAGSSCTFSGTAEVSRSAAKSSC